MNTARRFTVGLGAAVMMSTLAPVAHATIEVETPTVTKYQAVADMFGCRFHNNVLCGGRGR